MVSDAVVATSQTQAAALWKLRESISESQKREGASIKHDIAVPVAADSGFPRQGDARRAGAGARRARRSASAIWATATCISISMRPKAGDDPGIPRPVGRGATDGA